MTIPCTVYQYTWQNRNYVIIITLHKCMSFKEAKKEWRTCIYLQVVILIFSFTISFSSLLLWILVTMSFPHSSTACFHLSLSALLSDKLLIYVIGPTTYIYFGSRFLNNLWEERGEIVIILFHIFTHRISFTNAIWMQMNEVTCFLKNFLTVSQRWAW